MLWDLDAQAASTFILGRDAIGREARSLFARDTAPGKLVVPTAIDKGVRLCRAPETVRDSL